MSDQGYVPVVAGGVQPQGVMQAKVQGLVDVVAPNFPEGCELLVARPGSLEIAVRIMVPVGALILYVDPESAANMRPNMQRQIEQARAATARAAQGGASVHGPDDALRVRR